MIYVNGVSNGVITSTGSHAFNIFVPSNQVLQISCTEGTAGNGWSLDKLTVRPPIVIDPPILSLTADGGQHTLRWDAVNGLRYLILWTPSLLEAFQPQVTNDAPINSWTDTVHTAGTTGFYKLEVHPIP